MERIVYMYKRNMRDLSRCKDRSSNGWGHFGAIGFSTVRDILGM